MNQFQAEETPGGVETRADVDVAGPADAPPLVFVHGTIFNRTMWAPQREALSDEFRVVVPDLPGHGARRDEPFRLDSGVAAVEDVVDELADDRIHLVGLSLGGYVATEFARRHSDAVDDLIISGSSANPVGLLGVLSRVTGGVALLASKSGRIERGVEQLAERWVRKRDLRSDLVDEIVDAGFDLRPFGQGGLEIGGHDFRAAFASFPRPKLVLNGQWDLLMRSGERKHADAADASVEVIDGVGHVCNIERPEEYTAVVRGFIERNRTRT